jgi:hypothetical protein
MIYPINFSKGLEIGAIYERLNAAIIFTIYKRLTSVLLRFYSFTYSSKQLEIILKSYIFYLSFSLKSAFDFFLLVIVELPFIFDYSTFFTKFITLIVFLLFFLDFLCSRLLLLFSFPLLSLEAEWVDFTKFMYGVYCYCLIIETGSF